MDISDILAAAAEETFEKNVDAYTDEGFDEYELPVPDPSQSAADVLKEAAKIVNEEDKLLTEEKFVKAVAEVKSDVENIEKSARSCDEAILIEASNELQALLDTSNNEISTQKYVEDYSSDEGDEEEENFETVDYPELNSQLIYLTFNGKTEGVKSSLKNGADYFYRDRHGWTALHWAASKGFDEIIEVLIRHVESLRRNVKRYVNAHDSLAGWTALHVACVSGHKNTVEILLAHKARRHKRNFMKETAVECIGKCRAAASIRALLTSRRRQNAELKDDYYLQDTKAEGLGRSGRYSAGDDKAY